jgi:hypothetical protein
MYLAAVWRRAVTLTGLVPDAHPPKILLYLLKPQAAEDFPRIPHKFLGI